MVLTVDRTNYAVSRSEAPVYELRGGEPNQNILWSLTRGEQTVTTGLDNGDATGPDGSWSGQGPRLKPPRTGHWKVTAQTGQRQASVRFLVSRTLGTGGTSPEEFLGVTHVGGLYRFATPGSGLRPDSFLLEGAKLVRNLGVRNLFVYATPQYSSDYLHDDFGDQGHTSLKQLMQDAHFQRLFEMPFDTFVITAYTFANWKWIFGRVTGEAIPLDTTAEEAEMADLVHHLVTTYPGKRFVLKNWEGDWQLKASFEPDQVATNGQIEEFRAWLTARQAGVLRGRERARSEAGGVADDAVLHALEFNLIHQAQQDRPSMLRSVIPHVESDLISYSSWWTMARGDDVERNIIDDFAFVRSLPGIGTRPLMAAEFGFNSSTPGHQEKTARAISGFRRARAVKALYWEILDNVPEVGLIGREGTRFGGWFAIRESMGARNEASFVLEETELPSIVEAGERIPATISIRNEGTLFDPVVGYALGLFDEEDQLVDTFWIGDEVPKGGITRLGFTLIVPDKPGRYTFRMFQHGVEIFGPRMRLSVAPRGQ
jgi:hypothetical protein